MIHPQKQGVGAAGILLTFQSLQDPALLTLTPGYFLDLLQILRILWRTTAGFSALQKTIPCFPFNSFRFPSDPFLLYFRQGADVDGFRCSLEIQSFVNVPWKYNPSSTNRQADQAAAGV